MFQILKKTQQNLRHSTENAKSNLENTAHVPTSEEEYSIFMENPKRKSTETVNDEIQDLILQDLFLIHLKLPYPELIERCSCPEIQRINKWLSSLLRNKEKLEEIAITTVNAECSAIIMNKVPEKLEDPGKFLIPCTDISKITRKPSKTSKHGHENGRVNKSQKPKPEKVKSSVNSSQSWSTEVNHKRQNPKYSI
ncbi:hypothetical protein Tco_0257774 [Tanacetum coccineum]